MKRISLGTAALLFLLMMAAPVAGQSGNLLQDPSFEAPGNFNVILNSVDEGTVFGVPAAWDGWILTSPRTEPWMNLVPDGYPHTGLFKFDGGRSLSISRGFATFTTAVFQRVSVAAGSNVRGSARAFMERGNSPPPGAQFRVGIDPNGGSDPLAPGIVWSPWVASPNSWVQATVDATVGAGGAVTLFLYSTQTSPTNPNAIYWDDATLTLGGGGAAVASGTPGSANVLPTPAFAPFVLAQGQREDGSIVHIVVPGDTLDAIAVAYQTTRDELLALNNLTSRNFLQLGQEILVRPPFTATPAVQPTGRTPVPSRTPSTALQTSVATAARTVTTLATTSTTAEATSDTTAVSSAATTTIEATVTTEATEVIPTETPTPPATATDLPPAPITQVAQAPTEPVDVTRMCFWAFDDVNQNRIQEGDEQLVAGATVLVVQGGTRVRSITTTVDDPVCVDDLEAGDYTAELESPDGYGPTTAASLNLRVQELARTNVRFGVAQGIQPVVPPTARPETESTPLPTPLPAEAEAPNPLEQYGGILVIGIAVAVIMGGAALALFIRGR
ncbi:MAG: LysM peptidoglycan-binding domain-containing protein [Chloroflexi bacterium]|nr:LysM peptidoglycan-binding domain-containing protein [Chloroflexota bacterium]